MDESNTLLQRLVKAEPNVPRYRQQLGRNLYNRGNQQFGEKHYAQAVQTLMEGLDVLARLVETQPSVWWYQQDLALVFRQLGRVYRRLGDNDKTQLPKAIDSFQSASKVYKGLAAREPRSAERVHEVAGCLFDTAELQAKLNRKDDMLRSYGEARDLSRRLVQSLPNFLDYRNLLGLTSSNLGHELYLLKRVSQVQHIFPGSGRQRLRCDFRR